MKTLVAGIVGSLLVGAVAAQLPIPQGVQDGLDDWQSDHGSNWGMVFNETTGWGRMLFGGDAQAFVGGQPFVPSNATEGYLLARYFIAEAQDILGVDQTTLVNERFRVLPFGMLGGRDKVTVRFEQILPCPSGDCPVAEASVNVLFDLVSGRLLSIDSTALPTSITASSQFTVAASLAESEAGAEFQALTGSAATTIEPAQLEIVTQIVAGQVQAQYAWAVNCFGDDASGEFHSYRVETTTDQPCAVERCFDTVMHAVQQQGQQGGTLHANVTVEPPTPGTPWPWDDGTNFEQVNLKNMHVTSSAMEVATSDADGEFTFQQPATDWQLEFTGPYLSVRTLNLDLTSSSDPKYRAYEVEGPNGFNVQVQTNPAADQEGIAVANAFYRADQVRDWVLQTNPLDSSLDSAIEGQPGSPYRVFVNDRKLSCQFDLMTNEEECSFSAQGGGFYSPLENGTAGIFLSAFKSVDAPNASFGTVLFHEMGHWIGDRYGNSNRASDIPNDQNPPGLRNGYREGIADVFAHYLTDSPVIEYGDTTRNAFGLNPTGAFRGDCLSQQVNPSNSSYVNGEPLVAAFWNLRQNLRSDVGDDALGGLMADALLLGWMNAFDTNHIHSITMWQLLLLDDIDMDLMNGSLNQASIEAAFTQQGFPSLPAQTGTELIVPTRICF